MRNEYGMGEPRNRVVQVGRFGGPDGLEVVDAPLPTAGRGEVRVRVLASSVEYTDVLIRRHLYPQTMHRRPPFVLGYGVVGEIDQLGDGVSGFQLGDRVADMTVVGSNAAYRTLRADRLTRVPAGLDAAEAATLILSWTTAYQLLHRAARVQRGQRVLVQGAAGAVGQTLLVLGKLASLELWGTARGEHAALIRELGATPIDYQREDFTRVLPGGFDVVFDGIGEDGYRRSLAALGPGGLLCADGYTAGVQAQRRTLTILMWLARVYLSSRLRTLRGGKRTRIYSINVMRARHPAWFQEDLERLFGMLAARTIRPRVAERLSFDEIADAHRRVGRAVSSKLVLCSPPAATRTAGSASRPSRPTRDLNAHARWDVNSGRVNAGAATRPVTGSRRPAAAVPDRSRRRCADTRTDPKRSPARTSCRRSSRSRSLARNPSRRRRWRCRNRVALPARGGTSATGNRARVTRSRSGPLRLRWSYRLSPIASRRRASLRRTTSHRP
jgi:NADPH:quinone reductase-like Zn-dependent oxidoreductase